MLQRIKGLAPRFRNLLTGGRVLLGDGDHLKPLSEAEIEGLKRLFSMPKFFVFGHARSGTTLLARLIRLHPEVHCNWQAHFFSRHGPIPYLASPGFEGWFGQRSNRWSTEGESPAILIRLICDYLMERQAGAEGKRIVGDKTPNGDGASSVRWLHALYPEARLIYIVRDGRDVALSKRIQAFIDQPEFLTARDVRIREALANRGERYLEGGGSIFTPRALRRIAEKWNADVRESHHAGKELFGERYLALRYEDLLEQPLRWMERLWDFLGADEAGSELAGRIREEMERNPAASWHAEQAPEVVSGLPRGVIGAWKQVFSEQDRRAFERLAAEQLGFWGYLEG